MVTRKEFLLQLAGGGTLLMLGGCGGGGDGGYGGTAAPAPAPGATVLACLASSVTANHGRELSIPAADLDSTTARAYNIRGTADHDHEVTFSAAQLAQLKTGIAVSVTSTVVSSHPHTVTETCA